MRYLIAYLAVGLLVLGVFALDAFARNSDGSSDWRKAADQLRRERQSWVETVIERALIPIGATFLIVVAWPFAIAFAVAFYRDKSEVKPPPPSFEPKRFEVKREDLLEPLAAETVETRELVEDPLHAAPERPFGHLHQQWLAFRNSLGPKDQIWSFESVWGRYGTATERRIGYAALREDRVASHFVKTIREI